MRVVLEHKAKVVRETSGDLANLGTMRLKNMGMLLMTVIRMTMNTFLSKTDHFNKYLTLNFTRGALVRSQ